MESYVISNNVENFILSNSYISPLDDLNSLEVDLKSKGVNGVITFDLLLCVGFSSNRYVSMNFNGNMFDIETITIIDIVDKNISDESIDFYKSNKEYLRASVLSEAQQFSFK